MKKILKFSFVLVIAFMLTLCFDTFDAEAADGDCTLENGCRVSSLRGEVWVAGQENAYRPLTEATSDIKGTYMGPGNLGASNSYKFPYSSIGVRAVYNGVDYAPNGFNVYYNQYGLPIYCFDGNLMGGYNLAAERFVTGDYGQALQAYDYALLSVLTTGENTYTNLSLYWSKLMALRALVATWGYDRTDSNNADINSQYAVYGLVHQWLEEDDSDYNTIASHISLRSRSELANYSTYYFYDSGDNNAVAYAKELYFEALDVAANYLENGFTSANYTEERSDPAVRDIITNSNGELVSVDAYHEFTVSGLQDGDSLVINDEIDFAKDYTGISDYYIQAIEINGEVISSTESETSRYLNRNLLEVVPNLDLSQDLHVVVTVHVEGYRSVEEGSRFEALDCLEGNIEYSISGSYSSSNGINPYDDYIGIVWTDPVYQNYQRFVSVEPAGDSSSGGPGQGNWTSSKELTLVDECEEPETQCDALFEQCEADPDSDACDEYDRLCEVSCGTTISNFNCCDANNELVISTLDNYDVYIDGPQDVMACFVEEIDEQVSAEGSAAEVNGAVDDNGNSYTLMKNDYCVVSCKEDYHMSMPTAKLVNAGRYFTFRAAVEGTKTCYTNTINTDLFEENIQNAQVELVEAYNEYLLYSTAQEAIDNGEIEETTASCNSYCGDTYSRYRLEVEALGYRVSTGSDGRVSIAHTEHLAYVRTSNGSRGSSSCDEWNYNEEGERTTCASRSCSSRCRDGDPDDIIDDVAENLADAEARFEAAQRNYQNIISSYNDCSEWETEIQYDPDVYYDYEETYLTDLGYANGSMDRTLSNTDNSSWYCTGNLVGNSYSSCSVRASDEIPYETNSYIYCDEDGCSSRSEEISTARYKKLTSVVDASYVPSTLFYNLYPTGEIGKYDENNGDVLPENGVALENKLPVSLGTDRGIYKYTVNMADLGEFYDNDGELGRLIAGDRNEIDDAVINRDEYSDFVDENGTAQYACAYLVNMGITENDHLICDFDTECTDGDCFADCVGPNCDYECSGDDCIANCIGAGCIYDSEAGSSLIERVVSLSNLFPNGTESYNWNREVNDKAATTLDEIEGAGNSIYDEEPILSVTITPSVARAIKEYNDEAEDDGGYSNKTMTCYDLDGYEGIACYSSFIQGLIDGYIEYEGANLLRANDIVNNRSLIMGNNYRVVGNNNTEYFTTWSDGISENDMIGPSWK